jgi:SP family general alpha glucoside:H+ symporter-like MFS transporter
MANHQAEEHGSHDINLNVEEINPGEMIVEHDTKEDELPGASEKCAPPAMRSKSDDLTVWEAVKRYKLVTLVAMGAAFSASLDGYRQSLLINLVS